MFIAQKIIDKLSIRSSIDRLLNLQDKTSDYIYNLELANYIICEFINNEIDYDLDGLILVSLQDYLYAPKNDYNFLNIMFKQKTSIEETRIRESKSKRGYGFMNIFY